MSPSFRSSDRAPAGKLVEKCKLRSPDEIAAVLKEMDHMKIVEALLHGVCGAHDLQRKTGIPVAILREQLKRLRSEGIVLSEFPGFGVHWLPDAGRMKYLLQYARTGVLPQQISSEDRMRHINTLADEVCRAVAAGVSEGHREVLAQKWESEYQPTVTSQLESGIVQRECAESLRATLLLEPLPRKMNGHEPPKPQNGDLKHANGHSTELAELPVAEPMLQPESVRVDFPTVTETVLAVRSKGDVYIVESVSNEPEHGTGPILMHEVRTTDELLEMREPASITVPRAQKHEMTPDQSWELHTRSAEVYRIAYRKLTPELRSHLGLHWADKFQPSIKRRLEHGRSIGECVEKICGYIEQNSVSR